jgi:hypothetical protein
MKSQDEIQIAHDRLIGILLGEAPVSINEKTRQIMTANVDVLCWVLNHDHNETFANNLEWAKRETARLGISLVKDPNK